MQHDVDGEWQMVLAQTASDAYVLASKRNVLAEWGAASTELHFRH